LEDEVASIGLMEDGRPQMFVRQVSLHASHQPPGDRMKIGMSDRPEFLVVVHPPPNGAEDASPDHILSRAWLDECGSMSAIVVFAPVSNIDMLRISFTDIRNFTLPELTALLVDWIGKVGTCIHHTTKTLEDMADAIRHRYSVEGVAATAAAAAAASAGAAAAASGAAAAAVAAAGAVGPAAAEVAEESEELGLYSD
jgi:hypothetical protein